MFQFSIFLPVVRIWTLEDQEVKTRCDKNRSGCLPNEVKDERGGRSGAWAKVNRYRQESFPRLVRRERKDNHLLVGG